MYLKNLLFLAIPMAIAIMGLNACNDEPEQPDTGIMTHAITNIGCNSATSGGSIEAAKLPEVTECGICWSKENDPELSDNGMIADSLNITTGEFTCRMYGLEIGKEYHVRAYFMAQSQVIYGNDISFTSEGCHPVTYGGVTYTAVQIGNQCWMAENLRIGTHIPSTQAMTNNGTTERYAYDDDQNNYTTYGALYQWPEVVSYNITGSNNQINIQGISPPGWHIPSDEEWRQLEMFLGMSQYDATNTGWRGTIADQLKPGGGTGFNAQFGGFLTASGYFADGQCFGYYWTSTGSGYTDAWYRVFDAYNTGIKRELGGHLNALAVRCVKD